MASSTRHLALIVQSLLGVRVALAVVVLGSDATDGSPDAKITAALVHLCCTALAVVVTGALAVSFLTWIHRVASAARAAAPGRHFSVSARGAVAWWFIPGANLLMPFRAVAELWCALRPSTSLALVRAWWLALLARTGLALAAWGEHTLPDRGSAEVVATVIAALLTARLVFTLSAAVDGASAATAASTPSEPVAALSQTIAPP